MIYVYCRIGLFSSLISHGGVVRSVVPHLNVFLPMFDESYNNRGYNKTDKTGNNRVKISWRNVEILIQIRLSYLPRKEI